MKATKLSLPILLIAAVMVLAFMLGSTSVVKGDPPALMAVRMDEWVAIHTANTLLLDQGPLNVYLPVILEH